MFSLAVKTPVKALPMLMKPVQFLVPGPDPQLLGNVEPGRSW